MELPHLTLYFRRLRAPLHDAPGQGIAQWTRLQFLAGLLLLPLLALLMKVGLLLLQRVTPYDSLALDNALLPAYAGVLGVIACTWGYTAGASQLQLLWADLGQLPPRQGERLDSPEWYGSSLPDSTAFGGIVAAGLWAALPPLAGGAWGLLILALGIPTEDGARQLHSCALYILSVLDITRLPHFLLAMGCLVLTFRRHWIRPLLPLIGGMTVAVHWLLGNVLHAYTNLQRNTAYVLENIIGFFGQLDHISPMAGRVFGIFAPVWLVPALLLLLYLGLRDAAVHRGSVATNRFLAGALVTVPHLAAWVWAVSDLRHNWQQSYNPNMITGMYAAGSWFASTIIIMPGSWLQTPQGDIMQLQLLGADKPATLVFLVLWWLGTMWFWWRLGLTVLRSARNHD